MPPARIDPELLRQLDDAEKKARAGGGGADVQAVFTLDTGDASPDVPSREVTERVVRALLVRAREASGTAPTDVNVFPNLGTFVVVALPGFVRAVIDQKGIVSSIPNRRGGLGLIAPQAKRPVPTQAPRRAARGRPPR